MAARGISAACRSWRWLDRKRPRVCWPGSHTARGALPVRVASMRAAHAKPRRGNGSSTSVKRRMPQAGPTRQVAAHLAVPVRTLTRWRQRCHDPRQPRMPPRGRPCVTSSSAARSAVLDLLEDTGPRLGLPTLRRVFPELRRCELVDLERDYRQAFRQSHRISREVLAWHVPRRVWAMDHARPPQPIDGRYSSILSVRDLGSGRQLAWLPVPDETEGTTCAALEALFAEYGALLVLKSDNGSAFRSGLLGDLLAQHGVTALFSPAVTPRYNGGV